MLAISEVVFTMSASSMPLALLAGGVGFALILLVAWTGLLYFKVLRLTGKDRAHGLNVLRELTSLIKAPSAAARSGNGSGDEWASGDASKARGLQRLKGQGLISGCRQHALLYLVKTPRC